ncbi:hypothetical protein MMC30_007361 [Trapelia coarctata]|nr:hypothetical protein [Trapelia coarctata]
MPSSPPKTGILNKIRARCDSWVMLDEHKGFVPLPRERILFTSPPRTTLSLQTPNSYPGKEPFSIHSPGGIAYLTNQRLVYLPTTPSPSLQSLSAPILNLQDTHVSAPFFGPNIWQGILLPVAGGGVPTQHTYVEIKMTFKDGGAFDFHSNFELAKETLSHAVEIARESGVITGTETGMGAGMVDLEAVHLEELPAYEEATTTAAAAVQRSVPVSMSSGHVRPPPTRTAGERAIGLGTAGGFGAVGAQGMAAGGLPGLQRRATGEGVGGMATAGGLSTGATARLIAPPAPEPDEPPPGYEEAQQSALVRSLEASVGRDGERER